jgi:uncharacterized membrane protein YhiD involved in acid resistance
MPPVQLGEATRMLGISEQEIVLRLAVAGILGKAIGLEGERVEQPAGLRDHGPQLSKPP